MDEAEYVIAIKMKTATSLEEIEDTQARLKKTIKMLNKLRFRLQENNRYKTSHELNKVWFSLEPTSIKVQYHPTNHFVSLDEFPQGSFGIESHSQLDINPQSFTWEIRGALSESLNKEAVRLFIDLYNKDVDLRKYFTTNNDAQLDHLTHFKLAVAQALIKSASAVLGSSSEDSEQDGASRPTNFIKNNKIPAPDDDDHPKRGRLPISIAEDLATLLDITDKEMATILTISIRTYHRLKLNGLLNPVASERLMLLKDLAAYGLEVFENQDTFNKWLRLPLRDLSNKSPLNTLDTATGFNQVKAVLERIEYGVYS